MTNDRSRPPADPQRPEAGAGAHQKGADEDIRSRSADPGQSSYGGFKNEDTRRQAQDLEKEKGDGGQH